jgi:hypothetical protein
MVIIIIFKLILINISIMEINLKISNITKIKSNAKVRPIIIINLDPHNPRMIEVTVLLKLHNLLMLIIKKNLISLVRHPRKSIPTTQGTRKDYPKTSKKHPKIKIISQNPQLPLATTK